MLVRGIGIGIGRGLMRVVRVVKKMMMESLG